MRLGRLPLAPLLLALAAGCAHFTPVERMPPEVEARLSRHEHWLSVSSFEARRGPFPPAELTGIKRWRVAREKGRPRWLVETMTSSFFGVIERARTGRLEPSRIAVDRAFRLEELLPYREGAAAHARPGLERDRYRFALMDGDRFQLLVNGGRGRVVFMPAPPAPPASAAGEPEDGHGLWYAPFGPESEVFAFFVKLLEAEGVAELEEKARELSGGYLRHDLGRKLRVVVDESYPMAYDAALTRALKAWNDALRHELFAAPQRVGAIDPGDCLTGFVLCVRWRGGATFPFTGLSGYTEMTFDPETGLIIGGIVTVLNDERPKGTLPDAERVRKGELDLDWVARAMLDYRGMSAARHPAPARYVAWLFLHEIGHFMGLAHDFHLDRGAPVGGPLATVMGYPPFPVVHLADRIGRDDLRRIAWLYGHDAAPKRPPPHCATLEALAPELAGTAKTEQCDLFAVGDEAEWYLALARHGRFGVFTTYPDTSHMPDALRVLHARMRARQGLPPQNVLTKLALVLSGKSKEGEAGRAKVRAYLCAQGDRLPAIRAQLRRYAKLELACAAPPPLRL